MKQTFLLMLAIFSFACSETTTDNNTAIITSSPDSIAYDSDTVTMIAKRPEPEGLPSAQVSRIFSDTANADHFRLVMVGPNLLNSYAKFTIKDPSGRTIYRDSMSTSDLEASMVYEMKTPIATADERQAFLRKRVKEFFDEKHFSTPAIAPNDTYDITFGDEETWKTIKADPTAIGFSYLIGKENGRRIAYSKVKDKVMVVGYFGR